MSTDFSQDPQDNPYASPVAESMATPAGPAGVTPRRTSMDYMQAYTYIFDNPKWVVTVLVVGLFQIVPILGVLVLYGYVFEVVAVLAYGRAQYPEFNFDRFGPYILRGLWLFLVALMFQVASWVISGVVGFALGLIGVALGEEAAMLTMILAQAFGAVLGFALAFFMVPAFIRVGLSNELGQAFNFGWIMDFVSKMWLEQLLAGIFFMISAMLLMMLGILALCVGMLFAFPIIFMAYGHLCFQLYQIYLSRGGQPVPIATK